MKTLGQIAMDAYNAKYTGLEGDHWDAVAQAVVNEYERRRWAAAWKHASGHATPKKEESDRSYDEALRRDSWEVK